MPNLLSLLPTTFPDELAETLVTAQHCRIERIASQGHASPDGFWYDQGENEFVLLVQGAARLRFEDSEVIELQAGDWLNVVAHRRHRVEWTTPEEPTVWLAVFYD